MLSAQPCSALKGETEHRVHLAVKEGDPRPVLPNFVQATEHTRPGQSVDSTVGGPGGHLWPW